MDVPLSESEHRHRIETREHLEKQRRRLTDDVHALNVQLASRSQPGAREYSHEYVQWRRETIAKKVARERELSQLNAALLELRREMSRPRQTDPARRNRYQRIEAKLELLLETLGVHVPDELLMPRREDESHDAPEQSVDGDQHGTPWDDAIHRRVPGSFEMGKRR